MPCPTGWIADDAALSPRQLENTEIIKIHKLCKANSLIKKSRSIRVTVLESTKKCTCMDYKISSKIW